MELPQRYVITVNYFITCSDWRTHANTIHGKSHLVGLGLIHHDIVNTPFYGRAYDTAIIAHPLSVSDRDMHPRCTLPVLTRLVTQLRDIQRDCRVNPYCPPWELRARQDSIDVLMLLRKHRWDMLKEEYLREEEKKAKRAARRKAHKEKIAPGKQKNATSKDPVVDQARTN